MPDAITTQEVSEPVVETPVEEPQAEATPAEQEKKEEPKEEGKEEIVSIEDIVSGAKAKTPIGVQKRIDELTREKYAAKAEAEEWRKKAETMPPPAVPPSEISPARPLPPAELEFDSIEEFKMARAKYEDDLDAWRERTRAAVSNTAKAREEQERLTRKFVVDADRMAVKYPDFHEAVNQPIFAPQIQRAIFSSDFAPEIGYYLAKNPAVNERLHSLDALSLGREMGRLEVKFSEAKTRLVSSAPPPLEPLEGNDAPTKNPSDMDIKEWMEWDKKRELEKIKKKLGG